MNTETEINGNKYQIGRIDAKKQFHIVRRFGPLLASGSAAAIKMQTVSDTDAVMLQIVSSLLGPLSSMKDEDIDYVIDSCLDVVKRQVNGSTWAPVRAHGQLMYADIDMPTMLQLTAEVMKENLASFFALLTGATGLPGSSATSTAIPSVSS